MNRNNNRGSKERIHSLFIVVVVVVVVILKLLPSDQGEYFYRDNDRGEYEEERVRKRV